MGILWVAGLGAALVLGLAPASPAATPVAGPSVTVPECAVNWTGRSRGGWVYARGQSGAVTGRFGSIEWSRGVVDIVVHQRHDLHLCVGGTFLPGAFYSESHVFEGPTEHRLDVDLRIRGVGYGARPAPLRVPHEVDSGR